MTRSFVNHVFFIVQLFLFCTHGFCDYSIVVVEVGELCEVVFDSGLKDSFLFFLSLRFAVCFGLFIPAAFVKIRLLMLLDKFAKCFLFWFVRHLTIFCIDAMNSLLWNILYR